MTLAPRPFICVLLFTLLILPLGISGCKTKRFPSDQEPALLINWAEETPESLLKAMQDSTTSLHTFTAYFQISMDPPPARMPSSFSGILYLSKEGDNTRLRIKALHLFGTTLFDMVAQEGITKVYIPAKQTLYVGKVDKEQQEQAQGPQQIFSSLMINFAALHARPDSRLKIERDKVRLLLVDGEMWLDKGTGHILSLAEKDKTILYSHYQQLVADQPAMPTDIQLTTPQGKARCQLKEITLHDTLGKENFDLSSYQAKEIKELSEAGKE
jgi:hypothetical protein